MYCLKCFCVGGLLVGEVRVMPHVTGFGQDTRDT